MAKFGIGQSPTRREDERFLTGHGNYLADGAFPGALFARVVRSPMGHADITALDTAEAAAVPGVVAILTHKDVDEAGFGAIPCMGQVKNADGTPMVAPERPILARDRVRFVGEAVAMILAETEQAALDAEDLIEVDYEPLDAVGSVQAAHDAPAIWQQCPNNMAFDWRTGDADAVADAFKAAHHVARVTVVNNRVVPNSMETRGAVGLWSEDEGYSLHTGSQGVAGMRDLLRGPVMKLGEGEDLRVVTPDVGGGFGMKTFVYPEYPLVLLGAKKTGRPVRWIGTRGEAFLADSHGRDLLCKAELALDEAGRFLGYRVETDANLGAYPHVFGPAVATMTSVQILGGAYMVPAIAVQVRGRYTNTAPVDAYRGAGRPEATYLMERAVDQAAADLGLDQAEIRRRNLIPADRMPYTTAMGTTYDSGDFPAILEQALTRADWAGFPARRDAAKARGRLRGIGLAYYVECTLSSPTDDVRVDIAGGDRIALYVGTQSNGQSHETTFAQVLGDKLGIDPDAVDLRQGDTRDKATGIGTGGSHSLFMVGGATVAAAEKIVARGQAIMAALFDVPADDIRYDAGYFAVPDTNVRLSLFDVHARAKDAGPELDDDLRDGLACTASFTHQGITYPNGAHITEVEVDPDTGVVDVVRYTVVDDFGVLVNPTVVAGQVHGGVAQGLGQALTEYTHYDEEGQLVTGSFMDYGMPRADDMPVVDFTYSEIPCQTNPLGVKGCGEAGTIGALPAVTIAVLDALRPAGVTHIDMPATPETVWRALQAA